MTKSYKSIAIILSLIVCVLYSQSRVESSLQTDLSLNTQIIFSHSQKNDNNSKITQKADNSDNNYELAINESRTSSVNNNNTFAILSYNKIEDDCYAKLLSSSLNKMNENRVYINHSRN
jgi:preprotein translocase subunit SecF